MEFNNEPKVITEKILKEINDEKVVLDAVHSFHEWKIIQEFYPKSLLAVVTTPTKVRNTREEIDDKIKNIQRIKYWHSVYGDMHSSCLLSEAGWSFNGAGSLESQILSFGEMVRFLETPETICRGRVTIAINKQNQRG